MKNKITTRKLFKLLLSLYLVMFPVSKVFAGSLFSDRLDMFSLKIDGPDANKYSFQNERSFNLPYERVYQIIKDSFSYNEKGETIPVYKEVSNDGSKTSLLVKVRASKSYRVDSTWNSIGEEYSDGKVFLFIYPDLQSTDCGKLIFKQYRPSEGNTWGLEMFPGIALYEINILRNSETQTAVIVNFKDVSNWYKSPGSYDREYCLATEEDLSKLKSKNINIHCVSTGEFEEYVFNRIQKKITEILEAEEKKKRQEEEKRQREEETRRREEELRKSKRIKMEQKLALRNSLLNKFLPMCNGTILNLADFIMGKNPYADKDKCALIQAATFQMTSERTGLFEVGREILYIEFPETFRGPYVRGIAKIKGVYTYPTRFGTTNTVPHLLLLEELSYAEYNLLERGRELKSKEQLEREELEKKKAELERKKEKLEESLRAVESLDKQGLSRMKQKKEVIKKQIEELEENLRQMQIEK